MIFSSLCTCVLLPPPQHTQIYEMVFRKSIRSAGNLCTFSLSKLMQLRWQGLVVACHTSVALHRCCPLQGLAGGASPQQQQRWRHLTSVAMSSLFAASLILHQLLQNTTEKQANRPAEPAHKPEQGNQVVICYCVIRCLLVIYSLNVKKLLYFVKNLASIKATIY